VGIDYLKPFANASAAKIPGIIAVPTPYPGKFRLAYSWNSFRPIGKVKYQEICRSKGPKGFVVDHWGK
jgi:hypothetical protein